VAPTRPSRRWIIRVPEHAASTAPGRTILVLRALPGLGDLLTAIPALRAIREHEPSAHVALVGLAGTAPLVERFGRYIDELIPLPGFPGLPEQPPDVEAIPGFLWALQARHADLAINFHGSGWVTNPLVALFGARATAGYHVRGEWRPDARRFLEHDDSVPEVIRWLRLTSALGWPSDDARLEFPVRRPSADEAAVLGGLGGTVAVIHPGASVAERRWSPDAFALVADSLAAAGASVVLTGSDAERDVTAAVAAAMRAASVDLAGRTSLDGLASLLQSAAVLVCNDTGVSHLADALGTPSVVIFVGSEIDRWAPLDRQLHRRIVPGAAGDAAGAAAAALELVAAHASRRTSDAA
jgi:ADP-heptose:LPS heptosyltransferase